jgi:YadA-like membrane anchor domain/Collagen triple helix repeat (20 copies)
VLTYTHTLKMVYLNLITEGNIMNSFAKIVLASALLTTGFSAYATTDNFCHNHPESSQCTGTPGPQGPMGPQGPIGPQGPAGPQGPIGPQGPAGINGIDGVNGTNGVDGINGKDGTNGIDGAKGDTGPQGPQGEKGEPGSTVTQDPNARKALNLATDNASDINEFNKNIDDGVAMSAAIGTLPQAYGIGKTQISAGLGGYESNTALAVGVSHRLTEETVFKFGVATKADTGGDPVYGASVGYEF